jgi:hypothetical protein
MKKFLYYLQLFDGLWSVPIAFLVFFFGGYASFKYFGDAIISTEYLQQVLLAGLILIFANFMAFLGGFFNFRSLQGYFYSREVKDHVKSNLSTWQRIKLYLLVYFGLLVCFLFILRLVMQATS